ncbi:MAG: hypothetical protein JWL89_730 [Candidatus Saccharibacteria bacterium]|nr:hypothetical protein [Candidatus Saccharibacteria bacterium]
MNSIRLIILMCFSELLLIFFDYDLYYSYGRHHSKVPFYIASTLTVIVVALTTVALYQAVKHRNDSEPW